MTLEDVINQFMQCKNYKPLHVNELLDFVQSSYVHEKLSITQYRNIVRELNARGAIKPEYSSIECQKTYE